MKTSKSIISLVLAVCAVPAYAAETVVLDPVNAETLNIREQAKKAGDTTETAKPASPSDYYTAEKELLASLAEAKYLKATYTCGMHEMLYFNPPATYTLQTDTGKEIKISISNPRAAFRSKDNAGIDRYSQMRWKRETSWLHRIPVSLALTKRLLALNEAAAKAATAATDEAEAKKEALARSGLSDYLTYVQKGMETIAAAFDEVLARSTTLRLDNVRGSTWARDEKLNTAFQFETGKGDGITLFASYPYLREEIRSDGEITKVEFTIDEESPVLLLYVYKDGEPWLKTSTKNGEKMPMAFMKSDETMLATPEQLIRIKPLIEKAMHDETDEAGRDELKRLLAIIDGVLAKQGETPEVIPKEVVEAILKHTKSHRKSWVPATVEIAESSKPAETSKEPPDDFFGFRNRNSGGFVRGGKLPMSEAEHARWIENIDALARLRFLAVLGEPPCLFPELKESSQLKAGTAKFFTSEPVLRRTWDRL